MKKTVPLSLVAAAWLLAATAAGAQVTVTDAWVRATVPQQKATGAFMQLSAAKDTRLVAVSTPAAGLAELHEMATTQDNVMKMRHVAGIDLPAGRTVELKPGGQHLMLMDLRQQAKEGDTVPLTLVFEGRDGRRESVEVKAPVRALNAAAKPPAHGEHRH